MIQINKVFLLSYGFLNISLKMYMLLQHVIVQIHHKNFLNILKTLDVKSLKFKQIMRIFRI